MDCEALSDINHLFYRFNRIFDVELLLLAKLMVPPVPIAEVPIRWNEVSGSKLSIVKDSITMAIELLIIRLNYLLGVWKVPKDTSRLTTT